MIFDQTTSGVAGGDDQTRTGRALKRRRDIDGLINESKLKKVKTIKIKVDDKVYDDQINFKFMRQSKHEVLYDELDELTTPYKYPYQKLKMGQKWIE
jgi:hypothetical protein